VRAAVAVGVVTVVALFVEDDAVAAFRRAGATAFAGRLVLAVRRAAIEGHAVAVVAALGALDDLVAAGGMGARAWAAVALPADLDLARIRAPVPAVLLPSSHCSGKTTKPSPQRAIGRQGLPGVTQEKPGSTLRQLFAQPSPDTVLPSSQASSLVSSPLPQLGPGGASEPTRFETLPSSLMVIDGASRLMTKPASPLVPPVPSGPPLMTFPDAQAPASKERETAMNQAGRVDCIESLQEDIILADWSMDCRQI